MKPVVLCILDGVGVREDIYGNAFKMAKKPNFDYLWEEYPHAILNASEEPVGLPKGQMGNSEVGHMNIGAGRVMYQELLTVDNAIKDGSFYSNKTLIEAITNCKKNNSNMHIMGIVSDGGVHGHINHLLAILELCKRENFSRVYIHAILDGRDTTPMEAPKHIKLLQDKIDELGIGKIVTIQGRYYIMNRDRNWNLTELGYNTIINGISDINVNSTEEAFKNEYSENLTDEFMKPTVIESIKIKDNDSIISYNYRSDRLIQFSRALLDPDFKDFNRGKKLDIYYVTMTEYEEEPYYKDVHIVFNKHFPVNTLGEIISNMGLLQLRLSEFEKRLHVTFYFSGCKLEPYKGETDILLERPDVFTYDEKPEMRAYDITTELINAINSEEYALIVVNYPNGDAVGHSGVLEATIKGIETIDECLGRIIKETDLNSYTLFIFADHGNSEHMIEDNGEPDKKHTTNPVPIILCDKNYKLKNGKLADIAPSVLSMREIEIPKEMTGDIIIER